ncbi:MAG: hypothetical protein ACOZF2_00800 [Thermodesulfobacteriota bacterium]
MMAHHTKEEASGVIEFFPSREEVLPASASKTPLIFSCSAYCSFFGRLADCRIFFPEKSWRDNCRKGLKGLLLAQAKL